MARPPISKIISLLVILVLGLYIGPKTGELTRVFDAITAIHEIYNDIQTKGFPLLYDIMDSLETSIDEDCVYACPNKDVLPVKKPSYNPHPDGCNLIGLNIGRMLTVEINECCKAHGACYETCNNSKDQCDQDLKRCLYKYCEDFGENSTDEHTQSKSCHGVAKMLYAQQIALGCRSYLDSQARACDCQGKRKIKL